ncbi:dihydrodipicolinate synthase [Blastopirellula marina DSM 3645]|uniref:Dihydrodipicolinate synthase n=2 Tax=Blastopirellula marina TaxID=124 RepID=A3ZY93_9BACT|nr:dihydrodipicolinate synthase [Blastopirellula marina DSM 3645]
MVTPCKEPGEVDPSAMRRLAELVSSQGCDGLFVLGSTGEMILLDESDRRAIVTAAAEGAAGAAAVMVGVGGYGVKQAIRFARFAQQDGADYAIAMAPFFQRLSQAELLGYFVELAEQSPLPIGIYHHLRMTTSVDVETFGELASHPNILLCKDTSNDLNRMRQLLAATEGQNFRVLQGIEMLILDSLNAGAHGCVSALAGIAPQWHRTLIDSFKSGNTENAQASHAQIAELTQLFQIPEIRISLAHQVHALKHSAKSLGLFERSASMLTKFQATREFEQAIENILLQSGLLTLAK